MQRPLPEVIVVAYGPVVHLRTCLDSLGQGLVVHVIDNGASDEAEAVVQRHGSHYLRSPGNIGFAAAVNLGLRHVRAGADVLLLNPDASISVPDVLRLQRELDAVPRTAAVAPRLQRPDGAREPTSWPFPRPSLPWRGVIGRGSLRGGEPYFLSGAVLLLASEALASLGGLDERFFLYAEETDWQQAAVRAGWSVREVDTVTALHVGSATSSSSTSREQHFHRSAELYVRKWHGTAGWRVFRVGSAVAALRRALTAKSAEERMRARTTARLYVSGSARRSA